MMLRTSQASGRPETLVLFICLASSLGLLAMPDDLQIVVADRLGAVVTGPYRQARNLGEDILRLRRENEELLGALAGTDLAAARRQRQDRDRLLGADEAPALPGPLLPCQVEARKIGRFVTMIKITSAVPAGWRPYQPVMSRDGLLGRIRRVTGPRSAWVELLNGPGFALGCEIQRTGLLGVLHPRVDDFELDMVGRDEDVRPGDLVYTSGIAEIREEGREADQTSLMPRGLPVGVVSHVSSPADKLFKSIHVKALASFVRNATVFVVGARPLPEEELADGQPAPERPLGRGGP